MEIKKTVKTVTTTTVTTEVTTEPAAEATDFPKTDKYQKLIKDVKAFMEKQEAIKGEELTDEDFNCKGAPCKSRPEIVFRSGNKFWIIDGVTIIDRSNEQLIDNATTFNVLLRILADNPEMLVNAKAETEEREAEARDAKLRERLGDDYDLVFDKKKAYNGRRQCVGAEELCAAFPRIAALRFGNSGTCEVFSNGYAVYDNENRKTVLWVPDCGTASYYFAELKDKEKEYLVQSDEIGMDVIGELPWYDALVIAGENRIEYNMMKHPKSKGTESDSDYDDAAPATGWIGGARFPNPEQAYLEKEAAEERRKALTEKQQSICDRHFNEEMSIRKIAKKDNVDFTTVREQVRSIKNILKKNPERYFSNF